MSLISINPSTGETIASFNPHTKKDIQSILKSSTDSQNIWKQTELDFRLNCLKQL